MHGSIFFFSSRRRHTRYWRDWSSDVCSSDLHWLPQELQARRDGLRRGQADIGRQIERLAEVYLAGVVGLDNNGARSEEHTYELQSRQYLVCSLLLEKKKYVNINISVSRPSKIWLN